MIVLLIMLWETWKQPSYRSMNRMKASCLMSGHRPHTVYSMRRLSDALEPILILQPSAQSVNTLPPVKPSSCLFFKHIQSLSTQWTLLTGLVTLSPPPVFHWVASGSFGNNVYLLPVPTRNLLSVEFYL